VVLKTSTCVAGVDRPANNQRFIMNHKVKYSRKEYREEYLNSEEWKSLRSLIMSSKPDCQCCKEKATDVHHLVYRNIVDIKISDLLPVCRPCHNLIHEAIKCKYISQDVRDLLEIKNKTLSIRDDESFQEYKEWFSSKHFLSKKEIEYITSLQPFVIKKISALIKKNIWYPELDQTKFSGAQILKIRELIRVALYRRSNKIDHRKEGGRFGGKFGISLANLNNLFREDRRDTFSKKRS
jgi:hypothetical protein